MNQEHDGSIENEIFRIETDIFAAIKGKDTNKLDQILSDNFIYRNPMEGDRSRPEFLAAIESLPVEYPLCLVRGYEGERIFRRGRNERNAEGQDAK